MSEGADADQPGSKLFRHAAFRTMTASEKDSKLTHTLDESRQEYLPVLSSELTLREAASSLDLLVHDLAFLSTRIHPWVERARDGEDWFVAHRHDAEDGSYSLQIFVWPPGTGTEIHDHSSWGAYHCAVGTVREERYERLDDGSEKGYAHLRMLWERTWGRESGGSIVLPHAGGIHRVSNPAGSVAISVHLYGPRMGVIDGRDYDPSRDYVCDRTED